MYLLKAAQLLACMSTVGGEAGGRETVDAAGRVGTVVAKVLGVFVGNDVVAEGRTSASAAAGRRMSVEKACIVKGGGCFGRGE